MLLKVLAYQLLDIFHGSRVCKKHERVFYVSFIPFHHFVVSFIYEVLEALNCFESLHWENRVFTVEISGGFFVLFLSTL